MNKVEFLELPDWVQKTILEEICSYYIEMGKPVTLKEAKILASAYEYTSNGMMRKIKKNVCTAMQTKTN